jgi:hypothetical protein
MREEEVEEGILIISFLIAKVIGITAKRIDAINAIVLLL